MATLIQAIVKYGPRLARRPKATTEELAERLALATGVRHSSVTHVLMELEDAILSYGRRGVAVELPGIGTFAPRLAADGEIRLRYRPAGKLRKSYRPLDGFEGEVINRDNIGLPPEAYKALWDAEHPDDPMDLTPTFGRSA